MWNNLINLTPRKLSLALLIIGIGSLSSAVIYLYKSNEKSEDEKYRDCRTELMELRQDYFNLSRENRTQITGIYTDVIKQIKENNNGIKKDLEEIRKKRNSSIEKQQYLQTVIEKLKTE